MTNNVIDLATTSKPDGSTQQTNEFGSGQPTSRLYPTGYNYDDAIPSVGEFYAGKQKNALLRVVFF